MEVRTNSSLPLANVSLMAESKPRSRAEHDALDHAFQSLLPPSMGSQLSFRKTLLR